jgi:hypothetical protein
MTNSFQAGRFGGLATLLVALVPMAALLVGGLAGLA